MKTEKHFELTDEFTTNESGIKLYRIKCTKTIPGIVEAGTLGGLIEKPENLSNNAWVSGDARVYGDAQVYDNARVYGDARVSGDARVCGNADYCCFQSFGSTDRTTTAFREKDGNIKVSCGCFSGTLPEFEKKVTETHGDNQYGRKYKAIIEVIKIKFN
jgi:hypothetical protein